jgi:hypothetical protein
MNTSHRWELVPRHAIIEPVYLEEQFALDRPSLAKPAMV